MELFKTDGTRAVYLLPPEYRGFLKLLPSQDRTRSADNIHPHSKVKSHEVTTLAL